VELRASGKVEVRGGLEDEVSSVPTRGVGRGCGFAGRGSGKGDFGQSWCGVLGWEFSRPARLSEVCTVPAVAVKKRLVARLAEGEADPSLRSG